jgi:trimeric autotransporter adhesin
MTRNFGAFALIAVLAVAGCGGSSKPKLTSIAVSPSSASVLAGSTQQFTARANYSDNSSTDVSTSVTWASSSTSVATISAGGLATGVAAGTSNITATLQGVTSPAATLTVTAAPVLQSIAVAPANPSVASPNTQQFTATGTYLTGTQTSTQDITSKVTWASSNPAVATISAAGLATSAGAGTTTISATLGSVSGNTVLTVTGVATPVSLQVTPLSDTVSISSTVPYNVVELLSDGTTRPPTGTVTWTSGTTSTATIGSSTGIAIASSTGATVITATEGSLTGTANLTVQAAAARFAFNADSGQPPSTGGLLTEWSVNPATGAFTPVTTTAAVYGLQQIIVHPSGHYFYGINQQLDLNKFTVNSTSGAVTASGAFKTIGASGITAKGAIDPTGRFIYLVIVPQTGTPGIYSFSIDQTTGNLTAIGNPITANLANPSDILIDKTGTYAYVIDGGTNATSFTGQGTIYQYQIDLVTGALTAIPAATVTTGQSPWFGAFNPAGTFLYVPNVGDASVSTYSVGSSGQLTKVGADAIITGPSDDPFGIAVDPSGKYVYVDTFNAANLYGLVIQPDGTVSASHQTPGSPYTVGATTTPPSGATTPLPWGITIDPSGRLLVVDNNAYNSFTAFILDPTTGGLTVQPDVATGQIPYYLSFYSAVSGQ